MSKEATARSAISTFHAMKLALEALENSVDLVREDAYQAEKLYGNYPTRQGKVNGLKVLADDHEKAITALREALAEQPAQQQEARIAQLEAELMRMQGRELKLQFALAAPVQQEPVAWMYPDDYERMSTSETFCTVYSVEVGSATRGESTVALYTSPPAQRPWVGLTDEEIEQGCKESWVTEQAWQSAVWWAEAKLKDKNT